MNTLEDRLSQDLQATDRSIEVSDTDVLHAEHRYLRRRRELTHRRHSRTALLAAAAAVAVVASGSVLLQSLGDPEVAPATPGPETTSPTRELPLTRENLAGVWMLDDHGGWLWTYRTDGQVSWDNPGEASYGEVDVAEVNVVPYGITATRLTLPLNYCDFEATLDSRGLSLTVERMPDADQRQRVDSCPFVKGETFSQTRLSPAVDGMTSLSWSADQVVSRGYPVSGLSLLHGAWLKQGTGQLLVVTYDTLARVASYRLDDDGEVFHDPDDQGTARLDANGTLVLASSENSDSCARGNSAVLTELSQTHSNSNTPLGTALEIGNARGIEYDNALGGCSLRKDLVGTWIKVS